MLHVYLFPVFCCISFINERAYVPKEISLQESPFLTKKFRVHSRTFRFKNQNTYVGYKHDLAKSKDQVGFKLDLLGLRSHPLVQP